VTPTALDKGRRSPRKLLRAVVARLLGRKADGQKEEPPGEGGAALQTQAWRAQSGSTPYARA